MDAKWLIAGVVLLALAAFSSAFSVESSADVVVIQGTQATVLFTATNNQAASGHLSFSTNLGELNGFFDTPVQAIGSGETKGTYFHVRAPDDFRGIKDLTITAQLCTGSPRTCSTQTKTLRVEVNPVNSEDQYRDSLPSGPQYVPAQPANTVWSNFVQTSYFDPTHYQVDLAFDPLVVTKAGEFQRIKILVQNRGAARQFDVAVQGDVSETHAVIFPSQATLQRSEAQEVFIDVNPANPGTYTLRLLVTADGRLVQGGYGVITVKANDVHDGTLQLFPPTTQVNRGDAFTIPARLTNAGTTSEDFDVRVNGELARTITIAAGSSQDFDLAVNTLNLEPGAHVLRVEAESANVKGSGDVPLFVKPAAVQDNPLAPVSALVTNDGNDTLKAIEGQVIGIPDSWTVVKGLPFDLAAGQTGNLTLYINRTTDDEAKAPILIVKSQGNEIERVKLPPIASRKANALTGLFTLVSNNALFLAGLIVLAIAIVLLAAQRRAQSDEREAYLAKLRRIRAEAIGA